VKIQWKSITKTVVHQVVVLGSVRVVTGALESYTGVDTSRFAVKLGTYVAGEIIADAVEDQTDWVVDKTFEMVAKQIKNETNTAETN
jgi:hypothetical protein